MSPYSSPAFREILLGAGVTDPYIFKDWLEEQRIAAVTAAEAVLMPCYWRCLAAMAVEVVPPFGQVIGVPTGGVPFADALRPHCRSTTDTILVVDDVLTTGGSIRRTALLAREAAPMLSEGVVQIVGLVVFARGELPPWCRALFQLPKELWNSKEPVTSEKEGLNESS